jgi:RecA-family ATPase
MMDGAAHDAWLRSMGIRDLGKPKRQSTFYSAASLKGRPVPARQWLVLDLVPCRTVTMLGGDGGTGKSLLALQLAVAAAAGRQWIGQETAQGRALFISAEDDDDELHRRLADILDANGLEFGDLDNLTLRSLAGEDALMAALDAKTNALVTTDLYAEIDDQLAAERPAVLFLDTLADLHCGNENNRAHARQFIGMLRRLAIRHDCAVILLAHPSLTGMNNGSGLSGSTAWNGSVRSRLYLERVASDGYEPNPDARVLTTKKANYSRTGTEIALTWQAGVFVPDAPETGVDRMAATAKAERVFLKLLAALTEQGRYVSASPGPTYAPSQFANHPEAEGCAKRALKSAMDALFGRGEIVNATHGRGQKARTHIARKSDTDCAQ